MKTFQYCEDRPEDTVEHMVGHTHPPCPGHCRVVRDVISDGELSRAAVVQAMVRNEGECRLLLQESCRASSGECVRK